MTHEEEATALAAIAAGGTCGWYDFMDLIDLDNCPDEWNTLRKFVEKHGWMLESHGRDCFQLVRG